MYGSQNRVCLRFMPLPATLALALVCLLPVTSESRTLVVRHDGTGDVPTIQAGIDSLTRHSQREDILMVMPGRYEEDLRVTQSVYSYSITCPAGPDSTSVRSLILGAQHISVSGLQVNGSSDIRGLYLYGNRFLGSTILATSGSLFQEVRNCAFLGDVDFRVDHVLRIAGCEFRNSGVVAKAIDDGFSFQDCVSQDLAPK
jgi:hypothetical protein